MSLQPHVDRYAIRAFEKQLHAYDVVGDRGWEVDLENGTIEFDDDLTMKVALLGTTDDHTWLWGWADEEEFPDAVVAPGRALGAYGHEHGLPALYEPETDLDDDVTLDRIGVIASGVLDLQATYHAPLDGGGRVLFALEHPSLVLPEPDIDRLFKIVRESGFVEDWDAALYGYKR
ncbi:DUF6882 domain-containing protein [Solirubrobacter soli]|uniref:DUF6882 domain-containing protein n=1 Tax=Solirubrobacter soli TaxID=363832 RepID=UPI000480893F|nr:DUF6882 domain-containing protein [Solirubrobacter soli]